MTRGVRPFTVTVEYTARCAIVRGPVRVVHPAIRQSNADWRYDSVQHAYEIPENQLDGVADAIRRAGHKVTSRSSRELSQHGPDWTPDGFGVFSAMRATRSGGKP
jgi:hypothetical protein